MIKLYDPSMIATQFVWRAYYEQLSSTRIPFFRFHFVSVAWIYLYFELLIKYENYRRSLVSIQALVLRLPNQDLPHPVYHMYFDRAKKVRQSNT